MACGAPGCNATADPDRCNVCVPSSVTCSGNDLVTCAADGSSSSSTTCNYGCNAVANPDRCNVCTPDEYSCSGSDLIRCAADGSGTSVVETCSLGCVAQAGVTAAHCRYISPQYIPNICDTPATTASRTFTAAFTTTDSAFCTGGVIPQTGGAELCIIRYGTISITGAAVAITGSRVPVFVADGNLTVSGVIDVGATGTASGPGGGAVSSGTLGSGFGSTLRGGGGAGYRHMGGNGGSTTAAGGGNSGGGTFDPTTLLALVGGTKNPSPGLGDFNTPNGGGGGGALMLVSCKGTVTVSGTLDSNGGGGEPGWDAIIGSGIEYYAGACGGTGGYVVIQANTVSVTNTAKIYANGGGGGGGAIGNDTPGTDGTDGQRSTTYANGGSGLGAGGRGGTGGAAPTAGGAGSSPGGGGGAAGRFQVYAPTAGSSVTLTPLEASPGFSSTLFTLTTR
jgi:hypothetical protein